MDLIRTIAAIGIIAGLASFGVLALCYWSSKSYRDDK